jgi:hypothetical protein
VVKLRRVVIGSLSIFLAATAATAQQSGSTVSETVATVRDRDVNGAESVSETVVTRTTTDKDKDRVEVVIETYGLSMYAGRLSLTQRVRRVTTVTSDGSRTVEEHEQPPLGSLHEPLRVVRRSVTTVRRSGPDSYVAEQQVFDRDVNGRLVPVQTNIERSSRK